MNTDASSSTIHPLADPQLRFPRPSHRGCTFPGDGSTPSREVPSFETVPPTHGTSFDQRTEVGGCVCTHLIRDLDEGEGRGRTYGEEPFLLSEDGNRKTNFAGCVSEQFEITNVTGTLQGLVAGTSTLVATRRKVHPKKTLTPTRNHVQPPTHTRR